MLLSGCPVPPYTFNAEPALIAHNGVRFASDEWINLHTIVD